MLEWAPTPVDYFRHPSVLAVGRDGALLHLSAVLRCFQFEEASGFVADEALASLCPRELVAQPARVAKMLTEVTANLRPPLWERVDGGYRIVDWQWWAAFMRGAQRRREGNRQRQRRFRRRQSEAGDDQGGFDFDG